MPIIQAGTAHLGFEVSQSNPVLAVSQPNPSLSVHANLQSDITNKVYTPPMAHLQAQIDSLVALVSQQQAQLACVALLLAHERAPPLPVKIDQDIIVSLFVYS